MLAWPQHVVRIVALAIAVAVTIEAGVEGLVEAPIAAKARHVILQVQML